MSQKSCSHDECDKHYCRVQSDANKFREISDKLNLKNSSHIGWSMNGTTMPEETTLQFYGVEVYLKPDGTYQLGDTTGG